MGGDGRKRSPSPSPSPSPTGGEDEGKRRRGSPESHSRSRDDRGPEKKRKKKKKKKLKEKEKLQGNGGRNLDSFEEISNDDYFSKNNEFSTWLKEEKGTFFSELSSEAARELFLSFVKQWNRQKLNPRYYEGIAKGPRTGHSWKIR
ncbi:unnamed protein product [Spirodela intermedia]|uniref:Uncharacterized protein n=1 Tax=Spirodela intermedia TaxID=51605 RepID=A0A7I8L649_SPIIN|nr:unnamed protein product [Spirodela intermedia]